MLLWLWKKIQTFIFRASFFLYGSDRFFKSGFKKSLHPGLRGVGFLSLRSSKWLSQCDHSVLTLSLAVDSFLGLRVHCDGSGFHWFLGTTWTGWPAPLSPLAPPHNSCRRQALSSQGKHSSAYRLRKQSRCHPFVLELCMCHFLLVSLK